jgi:hypothetical protein
MIIGVGRREQIAPAVRVSRDAVSLFEDVCGDLTLKPLDLDRC